MRLLLLVAGLALIALLWFGGLDEPGQHALPEREEAPASVPVERRVARSRSMMASTATR